MNTERDLYSDALADTGWSALYEDWASSCNYNSSLNKSICEKYFQGYALSPVIIYNNKPYLSVYIKIQQDIEHTLSEFKDKKMLLHQIDAKYLRVIIL